MEVIPGWLIVDVWVMVVGEVSVAVMVAELTEVVVLIEVDTV
jgi:hypothetical protein